MCVISAFVLSMKLPRWIVSENMDLSVALSDAVREGNVERVLSELQSGSCHINAVTDVRYMSYLFSVLCLRNLQNYNVYLSRCVKLVSNIPTVMFTLLESF